MVKVVILGILQGVAEFLPISSSGHLVLARNLLGMGDAGLRLDIFLHLGTLLAVAVYYSDVLRRIVADSEWKYLAKIAVSAVPAAMVGFLCMDFLEKASTAKTAGGALVFTGIILLLAGFSGKGKKKDVGFLTALWMGVAQAVAVIPGVSRSGMTISAARALGTDAEKAAEFSFLMSAPPIAGAALWQLVRSFSGSASCGAEQLSWGYCAVGAAVSALVGYFSLKLLVKSLKRRWFWVFGPYCLAAGLLALILV